MRELEFLPASYLRARFQRRIGFLRSWLLLALGLAMVLWSFQVGAWVRDARAELEALRGGESAVDGDVAKVRMLRAEAQTYNRRLQLVRTLKSPIVVTGVLGVLTEVLPDGVLLEEVCLEHAENAPGDRALVRIRGAAPKETAVTEMLGSLEAAPPFGHAVLVESKPYGREEPERRAFVIEADVVPEVPAKER